MDDGDYDAAIAAASAAVSHIQSLTQEVGFEDEGLGLFDFDVSSAEADFCGWGRSRRRSRNQSFPGVLTPAQNTWHRPGDSGCRSWRI